MSKSEESNVEPSFLKGVLLTSAGSMSNIVVLFAETLVAVRILAPEVYGIYVLMVAVANFLVMGGDFGCKIAVIQQIASAERHEQGVIVNSVVLFRLFTCLVLGIFVWIGRDFLIWLDPSGNLLLYAPWIPLMFVVTSLDQLVEAMLKGFKQYQYVAIAQTMRSILRFALTLSLLFVFEMGIMGIVLSWIISFVISFLFQYFMLPIPKRLTMNGAALVKTLRFGAPIQATYFLWHVSGQIQVVLLSALAGPASVAIFDVAAKIPLALQRFSESFISVFFPTMSTLLSNKQLKQAGRLLDQSLKLSSFVGGIGVLATVLFSREIMGNLFSAQYATAALAFAVMMVAFHMMFLVNLLGYTLTSAGFPQRSLIENSVRAGVSVIASIALVPFFNFNGAALSRLLSNYLSNPVAVWLLRKSDIPVNMTSYVRQTGLLWIGCLVGWFIPMWDLSLPISILSRLAMIVLFVSFNFLLGTVTWQEVFSMVPHSIKTRVGFHKREVLDSV